MELWRVALHYPRAFVLIVRACELSLLQLHTLFCSLHPAVLLSSEQGKMHRWARQVTRPASLFYPANLLTWLLLLQAS